MSARVEFSVCSNFQLVIPGSHESGSTKKFEGYFADSASNRYCVTQDQPVWNQLVWGIRFLDVNVLFDLAEKEKYYLSHGGTKFDTLKNFLG